MSRSLAAVVIVFVLGGPGCASAQEPPLPDTPAGSAVPGCPASPNCVSTAAPPDDAEHHAEPLSFTGPVDAARARMRAIVDAMPRTKLVEETPTSLRYTFTSRIFRFVDDVLIVFVPETGKVEYRSASRVGRGDMGVNRKRMEAIAAAWRTGEAR